MGIAELAIAVIEQAKIDLLLASSMYELDAQYKFFESPMFNFWCNTADVGETTRKVVIKSVKEKHEILKKIIELCMQKKDLLEIKKGNIFINGCMRRALYSIEEIGEPIMYLSAIRVNRRFGFEIKL